MPPGAASVPSGTAAATAVQLRLLRQGEPESAARVFELAELQALGRRTVVTRVPWARSAPPGRWEGVPLSRLVAQLRGEGHDLRVSALNGYHAILPWSDISRFDPLLAWSFEGQPIRPRNKGPLVLVYPFDQHRELLGNEVYNDRSVWHVNRIEIQ